MRGLYNKMFIPSKSLFQIMEGDSSVDDITPDDWIEIHDTFIYNKDRY